MNKLYAFLISLFLTICYSVALPAQGSGGSGGVSSSEFNPLDDIQVPSPNATAFARYAENPVGLYTGSVDVKIPLYTLPATRGVSVPIGLSYAKGGIKVDEVASDVGLGWVLNGGGVIRDGAWKAGRDASVGVF